MAVAVKSPKSNKNIVLLNPWEKGQKAFNELTNNCKLTNSMNIKFDKKGKPIKLTNTEKAYRNGYLQAQKDARECYKSKHPRKFPKK